MLAEHPAALKQASYAGQPYRLETYAVFVTIEYSEVAMLTGLLADGVSGSQLLP